MKEYIPQIIESIIGTGFLAGIYMLLKVRAEAGQITVVAAQGAVIVQTGVIESLREDLLAVRTELKELKVELRQTRIDLSSATTENDKLRLRIKKLENSSRSSKDNGQDYDSL